MAKFNICISAFIEQENDFNDYLYTAKSVIEQMGHKATRCLSDVKSSSNFESVLEEECDFFVIMIDKKKFRLKETELNAALARGIPILVFAKSCVNNRGKKTVPMDALNAIRAFSPELCNIGFTEFDNCERLAKELRQDLEEAIVHKMTMAPVIGLDPPISYTEGIKLIRNAKYRVIISQRTSCMFLGPRKDVLHEQNFYEELLKWLKNHKDQNVTFLHYFSLKKTLDAAQTNNYSLKTAKENLRKIFSDPDLKDKITFRVSEDFEAIPHVIGDTGFGFNFFVGENRYYLFLPCFFTKNRELEHIITNTRNIGRKYDWDDIEALYRQAGID